LAYKGEEAAQRELVGVNINDKVEGTNGAIIRLKTGKGGKKNHLITEGGIERTVHEKKAKGGKVESPVVIART